MAPPSGLHQSAIASDLETPFPPLTRSSTLPGLQSHHRADPSHLAPEDAFLAASPPRFSSAYVGNGVNGINNGSSNGGGVGGIGNGGDGSELRPRRMRRKEGSRSHSRRRKRFQKLLWVKQSYPDNYTDQATFLENLQRNPRLQPYDFWPLVADSTVIVQHVCSVIIFIVCFIGIFRERVSPVSVVGLGSFATFIGWLLWDWWVGQESRESGVDGVSRSRSIGGGRPYNRDFRPPRRQDSSSGIMGMPPPPPHHPSAGATTGGISSVSSFPSAASSTSNLAAMATAAPSQSQENLHLNQRALLNGNSNNSSSNSNSNSNSSNNNGVGTSSSNLELPKHHHYSTSASSAHSTTSQISINPPASMARGPRADTSPESRHRRTVSPTSRGGGSGSGNGNGGPASFRAGTIKSAILIYFTLLGLSPILKSLTRSTSSDSIWAMSFWLLAINIFFFDYSGSWTGVHKFPVASLSTNAALMASTVLASRLPSTGQVFSLTLFSIEVFGLFPVFRRYARHRSWRYHVVLTVLLVLGAGAGVGMVLGDSGEPAGDTGMSAWPWRNGLVGMLVGCLIAALAMGGCSWWLIGLQKYKNEIYGPWDPARPIIISRRHWDNE